MRQHVHISEQVKESLKQAILLLDVPYIIRGKKGAILERGKVFGTVRSGDATKTTAGNTLRVSMYLEYAMHGAPYDYKIWVSGDDASVWFHPRHRDDAERRLKEKVYTSKPDTTGALGQYAKIFEINEDSVNFLSKAITKSYKGFTVGRLATRALIQGRYTDGKLN